jgi:adenosylhomocysteine nucleosidase
LPPNPEDILPDQLDTGISQPHQRNCTMQRLRVLLVVVVFTLPSWVFSQGAWTGVRPIIIQGAMPSETENLASRLDNVTIDKVGGWNFWRGTVDGYPVIVSRTLKGMANAAAATAIAVERYHPAAIINQGTAGGLEPGLRLFDIVLGTSSVSLAAFKTPYKPAGAGSNSLDWKPMNLMASEGSAGADSMKRTAVRFAGDAMLLSVARQAAGRYTRGRVVDGVIGSSDMWNDEIDRISRFHTEFGASVEEMETAAAAQIAGLFRVPFLGIRVVSDNTTNGSAYNPKTGEACEDFVYQVVKAYVAGVKQ